MAESGMMARKLKMDTTIACTLAAPVTMPSGTKTQNSLMLTRRAVAFATW